MMMPNKHYCVLVWIILVSEEFLSYTYMKRTETYPHITINSIKIGKGASGAAVQNLNIALGVDETTGL